MQNKSVQALFLALEFPPLLLLEFPVFCSKKLLTCNEVAPKRRASVCPCFLPNGQKCKIKEFHSPNYLPVSCPVQHPGRSSIQFLFLLFSNFCNGRLYVFLEPAYIFRLNVHAFQPQQTCAFSDVLYLDEILFIVFINTIFPLYQVLVQ